MRRMTTIVILAACCALGTATTGRAKGPEMLFVSGWQGGGVYAIRPDTGEIVDRTKTPLFNNYFLAWSEQRQELYVAADNGGKICVLKTGPLRVVGTITQEVGWNAHAIAVSPDGGRLYVSFGTLAVEGSKATPANSRVCVYDLETRTLEKSLVLSDSKDERPTIALSSDGGTLYVSREHAFEVYNAPTLSLVHRSETRASACRTLAVSHDGKSAFEATNDKSAGNAGGFDVATTNPLSSTIAPAFTLKMSRFGDRVWVASGREVVECDTAFRVSRRFALPENVFEIEESLDGKALYTLVDRWDKGTLKQVRVAVVDLSSGTVVRTFDVPTDARHLLAVAAP